VANLIGVRPFAAGVGVFAGEQAASTAAKANVNRRKDFKTSSREAMARNLGRGEAFAKR
jgi:hypothetical protein